MGTRLLFILLVCFLSWNCSTSPETSNSQSGSTQIDFEQSKGDLPKVGFNCKASYNPVQQTAFADQLFSELDGEVLRNMVLRIPGGTRSQKDFAADWPDEKMQLWTNLQAKYGYSMVFVVNGNDTPENQLEIIRRWQRNGAKFEFLEMMTEYYLPKFSKPNLSKPEVTRRIDEKIYTEEILPTFYDHLDSLNLPYFLIFAPLKKNKLGQERYDYWNAHMVDYVNSNEARRELGVVLHLYQKDVSMSYDYDQIDRLRKRLVNPTPFAITELGVLDRDVPIEDHPAASVSHITEVMQRLHKGDYIMDQVLYHDYRNGNQQADLHPMYGGISPKGDAIVEYYNALFD